MKPNHAGFKKPLWLFAFAGQDVIDFASAKADAIKTNYRGLLVVLSLPQSTQDNKLFNIMQVTNQQLIMKSIEVAGQAYAPYSKFHVGAALLSEDGRIFTGCNVENISYGLTICAERNAVFAAVAAGCREFSKIVIATDTKEPASPCGACRQVLAEFNPDLEVLLANFQGKSFTFRLSELLPRPTAGILDRP